MYYTPEEIVMYARVLGKTPELSMMLQAGGRGFDCKQVKGELRESKDSNKLKLYVELTDGREYASETELTEEDLADDNHWTFFCATFDGGTTYDFLMYNSNLPQGTPERDEEDFLELCKDYCRYYKIDTHGKIKAELRRARINWNKKKKGEEWVRKRSATK